MASYTAADAERVFNRDMTEVHEHYARLAAGQRPAVRRAIASLTGTTPPSEDTTESNLAEDSDEMDAEHESDGQ